MYVRCRRKQREQKRYAKQVQAERLKEKAQVKKAGVASITKLRKQRQRDGFAGELDMDAELAGPGPGLGSKPAMAPGQRIRPGALWQILLWRSVRMTGTLQWSCVEPFWTGLCQICHWHHQEIMMQG